MSRPAFVLDTDSFTLFGYGTEPLHGRVAAAPGTVGVGVVTVGEALSG